MPQVGRGSMTDNVDKQHTGIFFSTARQDYVVLWEGREVCRYESIDDFVEAHQKGLLALEENQADLLSEYYRSIGISTGRNPD